MDFGIGVTSGVEAWRVVKRAESLGFSHAWFVDTQLLCADLFAAMAVAAVHTSRIRLGTGVLVPSNRIAPVTANGTEEDPGTLYAGADYLAANGQPLDFTVTGRADLTGLPMYLAFGDPPEGHPTIFQVSGGVVLSGAAGNQIVRFEALHTDTDALTNHHDELIVAVLQVNFGVGADQYTPVAEAWYRVRAKYVTP